MAQSIILKRSSLQGKVPTTSSLSLGELAVNTYDGKIYLNRSGSTQSIQEIVTTNVVNTGSITLTKTGSFGELVVTQDGNFQRDLYVTRDIITNGNLDILYDITASVVSASSFIGYGGGITGVTASMRPDDYDFNSNPFAGSIGYIQASGSLYKVATINTAVEFRYNDVVRGQFDIVNGFSGSIYGIGDTVAFSSSVASLNAFTSSTAGLSSLNAFTSSTTPRLTNLETTSASVNSSISNINSFTASNGNTSLNAATASFSPRIANLESTSASVNISISNLNSFSASNGNASLNQFTASTTPRLTNLETTSASVNISISNLNSFSASNGNASLNQFTSSINGWSGSLATTGSNIFRGNQTITGSVTISGTITANEFYTTFVSSSVLYTSGSTKFGDTGDDIMSVTGSLRVSGSTTITGSLNVNGGVTATNGFTGSLFGTASYALNGSSNAIMYQTASAASTWVFNHFLATQYPVVTVYDNTNSVIIPQSITTNDSSSLTITFSSPRTGVAVASKGGYVGSAVATATVANALTTARLINGTSFDGTQNITIPNLVSGSSQVVGILSSVNQFTSSINGWSGSLATTGSNSFNSNQSITGSLFVSGTILQNGGGLALQDGTILYHSSSTWFIPTSTVSTSGTTATSVGTQFTSGMVGAKLTILRESKIITAFTSTTQVTVDSAYSQNYNSIPSGSWGVFSKAFEIKADSTIGYYDKTGTFVFGKRFDSNVQANNLLSSTADSFYLTQNRFALNSGFTVDWTGGTGTGTRDTGIRRNNTGSLEIYDGNTVDGAVANRRDLILRNITGSNAFFSGSSTITGSLGVSGSITANTFIGSIAATNGVVSGSSQVIGILSSLNTYTGSNDTTNTAQNLRLTNLETTSASLLIETQNLELFTASAALRLTNLETTSASVNISLSNLNSFSASENTKSSTLATYTGSVDTKFTSIGASTASLNSFTSSLLTALTASGVNLTANGNLTVQGNLTIAGTQTIVNSTTVQLGDNIIELNGSNVANGGIYVKDPTAPTTGTGSFLWDSTNDFWRAGLSGSESRILVVGSMGVVSGSAQISIAGTSDYTSLFTGIASATSSLNSFSASNANTSLNTFTSSVLPRLTNLETTSASVNISVTNLNTYSASVSNSIQQLSLKTGSYATTGSNSFIGNQTISGSLTIGSASVSTENTLIVGAPPAGGTGEGGQILLAASGGVYTSASMIDNWQNNFRILRGTNAGSDALVAQWNMHTKQMQLPAYNSVSAFAGTATANLAVDSGGNIITVSTTGASVFPYIGNAVITGSLTTTGIIYATPNGGMYFQGGDDAALYDINLSNHMGIYGVQDSTVASIKLGSSGGVISGKNGSIGIGTINPTSGSLHVTGSIFAASITGAIAATNGVISGSSQIIGILSSLNTYTGSNDTTNTAQNLRLTNLETTSASVNISISNLNTYSASVSNSIQQLNLFTSSTAALGSLNSFTSSAGIRLTNLETTTASLNISVSNLNSYSASVSNSIGNLNSLTSSLTTTYEGRASATKTIFSGSSQVSFSGLSNISAGIVSSSAQITPLLPTGVVSGSSQVLGGTGIISSSTQLSGTTITNLTVVNLTTVNQTASVVFSSGSNTFGDAGNDIHSFTGSVRISGSLTITGSVSAANGFTGSLLGTASYALNGSSNAIMYQTASAAAIWTFNHYLQTKHPVIAVYDNTDSIIIPQSITAVDANTTTITFSSARTGTVVASKGGYVGSVVTSATTATSATSASVATTASYAISASAAATTFSIGASSTTYGSYINTIAGANTIISTPTGSFAGAFYNYIATSGSNARAGQVMAIWNNTTVQFTDVTTNDIGSTTMVTSSVSLSAGSALLNFTTNTNNWNIKTFVTYL